METIKLIINHPRFKRLTVLFSLGVFFYVTRSIFDLMFFTFIFSFLMYTAEKFFERKLKGIIPIHPKAMVMISAALIIALFAYAFTNLLPAITSQVNDIIVQVTDFYKAPAVNEMEASVKEFLGKGYETIMSDKGISNITNVVQEAGKMGLNLFLSLILSIFFMLERNRVVEFAKRFLTSKAGGYFKEVADFGEIFMRSFGTVIETQIIIAFVNAALSVIALSIMGMPQVLGLGVMILILGFVPVMGVIISLVPLCVIAFSTGGWMMVLAMVIMIIVLHAIESYLLNPNLMSHKTELPVFYVFVILLASEHFFGVWGLIIGVPLFIFVLELLGVDREKKPKAKVGTKA